MYIHPPRHGILGIDVPMMPGFLFFSSASRRLKKSGEVSAKIYSDAIVWSLSALHELISLKDHIPISANQSFMIQFRKDQINLYDLRKKNTSFCKSLSQLLPGWWFGFSFQLGIS